MLEVLIRVGGTEQLDIVTHAHYYADCGHSAGNQAAMAVPLPLLDYQGAAAMLP